MEKFFALISGWKRFALLVTTVIAEVGGFIPERYQPYTAIAVAGVAAVTKVIDTVYPPNP